MLKITIHTESEVTTLKLEGRLAGPWVEELNCCRENLAHCQQTRLLVDLTGVTFIDQEGKALLARFWWQGAELKAAGCLTTCIVEEIMRSARTDQPGPRTKPP